MRELKLAVNLKGWRIFIARKRDKAFLPVEKKILQRDLYTCQYCGFQAGEYQEVVNADGDYLHNTASNMVTACCFCTQCLFIQAVGFDEMGGGQLIYMPEMSQSDLNSFCHVLFCAMGNNTGYQETSQQIYRTMKFRSQLVENKFGSGMSNPSAMGQVLIEHGTHEVAESERILKDLRLLPSNVKFRVQLDAWAEAAMRELAEAEGTEEEGNT